MLEDITRTSPFKVVKFGTKIGYFNLQKAQNLSRKLRMIALEQRIFVGHLERASSNGSQFRQCDAVDW